MLATLLAALVVTITSCAHERPVPPAPPQLGTVRRIVDEIAPSGGAPGERARPVTLGGDTRPALPAGTSTTASFVVPPGAILRLGIGVEEPAWTGDSAPILFRVVYEDQRGTTQDLFRRILDPARKTVDRRWYDNDVDLSDLAGTELRLRFVTEPVDPGDTRTSLPVWADPRVLAGHGGPARPSIVMVSLGAGDANGASTGGARRADSAALAALASRGTLVDQSVQPGGSLNAGSQQLSLLAEQLRRAGFATAAIVDDAMPAAPRGFSTYDASAAGSGDVARTFGRAVAWAGRHADEPFFLFVQTSEPPSTPTAQQGEHDDLLERLAAGLARLVPDDQLLLVIDGARGPLLFVWPAHVAAGQRVAQPASSRDVAPTILQLVGLPVPPQIAGQSISALLTDDPASAATAPHVGRSAAASTIQDTTGRANTEPSEMR